MFRRSLALLFLVLALSSLLVACGDAVVPTYSNATAVALPDSFKTMSDAFSGTFNNATITTYKTTDDVNTVKTNLDSGFKNNGWSSTSNASDDSKLTAYGAGAFVTGYQKDDSGAIVLGLPGSDTTRAVGFDVQNGQTVYMVISGKIKS